MGKFTQKQKIAILSALMAIILTACASWVITGQPLAMDNAFTFFSKNAKQSSQDGTPILTEAEQAEQSLEILNGSLKYVPSNSITVSHIDVATTEDANAWWDKVRKFGPATFALPPNISEEEGITGITFASFIPSGGVESLDPFSYQFVVSTSPQETENVRQFFATRVGENLFVQSIQEEKHGRVIISDIPAMVDIESVKTGSLESFHAKANTDWFFGTETPAIYFNMSQYFDRLVSYRPDYVEVSNQVLTTGMGIQENTVWVATSDDVGETWKGKFISGGINAESVDIPAVDKAIGSTITLIPGGDPNADPDQSVEGGIASLGLVNLMDAISIATKDDAVGGIVNPMNNTADPITAEGAVNDNDLALVYSPQMLQSTYQGVIAPTFIHTVTFTVKGEDVMMHLRYYSEAEAGNGTPEPPNGGVVNP